MQPIIKKVLIGVIILASAYGLTLVPQNSAGKNACMNKFVKAKNERLKAYKQEKINDGDPTRYKPFRTVF